MNRVIQAENEIGKQLDASLFERHLQRGNALYFVAYKEEKQLEVWIQAEDSSFTHYRTYAVCAASGKLGRKLKEGDKQVPEGVYYIARFNPESKFHLSLGLNYPNEADMKVADRESPGSDIFIHGGCASIGCLAMTDEVIKEIYLLCDAARSKGQSQIPVYIFPFRMEESNVQLHLSEYAEYTKFWSDLQILYRQLKSTHRPVDVEFTEDGSYRLKSH